MVATTHPYWTGYLKRSFVACPIVPYPASSRAEETHKGASRRRKRKRST
jgi:non-homologous end joining protein Ku